MSNLPATIAAMGAFLVAIATFVTSLRNGKKADAAVGRADQLMTKTDEIHTATNGHLSALEKQLAVALQKIESMGDAVAVAKKTSDDAVQVARDTPVEDGGANR